VDAEHTYVSEYIHALLNGNSPNGAAPESFGEFRDVIENLQLASGTGDMAKVKEAWLDLVRRQPALAELVSSDQAASEEWQIYTLADAYRSRSPMRYVVDGLFPLPSVSIVYGAPGTLKSLLMADMAVSVAAGAPWLPLPSAALERGIPTLPVAVLWCDSVVV
jgi:hypothetical protein